MKKLYPVVSQLLSAGLVIVLFVYMEFVSAFIFGRASFSLPLSMATRLASVGIAYLIVELTVNRLKFSAGRKALILAVITIVPIILVRFFL